MKIFWTVFGTLSSVSAIIDFTQGDIGWGVAMALCAIIQFGAALEAK
jgi:hypothetical protein